MNGSDELHDDSRIPSSLEFSQLVLKTKGALQKQTSPPSATIQVPSLALRDSGGLPEYECFFVEMKIRVARGQCCKAFPRTNVSTS